MSDSGDSSDEDGITPLPYGAAIASPPSVRTGSAARNDSGERAEVPLSPQASETLKQSARIAYFSWKFEIRRDWYRSQNGRDLGAKVIMCTPVHGLSGFSAIDQT